MKLAMIGGPRAVPRDTAVLPWPLVHDDDRRAIDRVLASGKFTSAAAGEPEIPALEAEWAAHTGVRHCVAMANGTSALAIALAAVGVRPGDEVIVPALSFVATALAPVHLGAVPVFVDVERATSNLDPRAVAAAITPRTRAVVPVHLHGLPAEVDDIAAHGIPLVEDAAQAHGVAYRGRRVGGLGQVGVFSLNVSKNLPTCGEGALVTTDDAELCDRLVRMRQFGEDIPKTGERAYVSTCVGWNAKLSAIQAAFTRSQLARFPRDTAQRDHNVRAFLARLAGLRGLVVPRALPDRGHGWHILRFGLDAAAFERPPAWAGALRAAVMRALKSEGVPVSRYQSMPLSAQPVFAQVPCVRRPVPATEAIIDASFTLQRAHLHPEAGPLLERFAEAFAKVWDHAELLVRMADAREEPA